MRRGWVVPTALMTVATVAFPCGGSNSYDVDGPLASSVTYAERALYPVIDMLENTTRDEIRFLPGLVRADSARFAALLGRSPLRSYWWDTITAVRVPEPSATPLRQAWARGDVEAAVRSARTLVSGIMALPFEADSARDAALRLAVETIELAPAVAGQPAAARKAAFTRLAQPARSAPFDELPALLARDPQSLRRASLEYAALRGAVRTGVPDDTREEIARQVPAARWDSLQIAHRAWLARYPSHPYATLVALQRMRLFYLASQPDSAWTSALVLYGTHPARAAAEMRFMLQTAALPPMSFLTDARVPLEVRTALVGNMRPSPAAWAALMRAASERPRDALRENLEERLLSSLASDSSSQLVLPASFPAWRANASPLWRYLWAASQLRAGRADAALPYTMVAVTPQQDSSLYTAAVHLTARIHLTRGDYRSAALTRGLDAWTRRYIVRVLTPDSIVPQLATTSHATVSREARLLLAVRSAQAGQWSEAAAQVRMFDAPRAALYTRIGTLARDTTTNAGLLRYATALAGAGGRLFTESSRYFYRGMMNRDYTLNPKYDEDLRGVWDLPWTRAHERALLFRSLREGSERMLALRAFASYFERSGVTATQRQGAVRVADRAYRQLLDTDPSRNDSGFWVDSLPASAEGRAIRKAGRR
jgi:hypothetical protein